MSGVASVEPFAPTGRPSYFPEMKIELFWRLLRNRRAVVSGALAAVIVASWTCLWLGEGVEIERWIWAAGT
jgi:hypothetical protein